MHHLMKGFFVLFCFYFRLDSSGPLVTNKHQRAFHRSEGDFGSSHTKLRKQPSPCFTLCAEWSRVLFVFFTFQQQTPKVNDTDKAVMRKDYSVILGRPEKGVLSGALVIAHHPDPLLSLAWDHFHTGDLLQMELACIHWVDGYTDCCFYRSTYFYLFLFIFIYFWQFFFCLFVYSIPLTIIAFVLISKERQVDWFSVLIFFPALKTFSLLV